MSDPNAESPQARRARSGRNFALLIGLLAFVALVFVVTLARLGGNVASNGF